MQTVRVKERRNRTRTGIARSGEKAIPVAKETDTGIIPLSLEDVNSFSWWYNITLDELKAPVSQENISTSHVCWNVAVD
jgi:hypothetical protein